MPCTRLRSLAGVLALGAVLLAGCAHTAGRPGPAGPPVADSGPKQSLPPRPRDLDISGIDACGLFTTAQRHQLGVTDVDPGNPNDPLDVDQFGNPGCDFHQTSTQPYWTYLVIPVYQEGADAWLNSNRNVTTKIETIAGYGAVETRLHDDTTLSCTVIVDVDKGENLTVQFGPFTAGAFTLDQMCTRAALGATDAVRTLSTQRK